MSGQDNEEPGTAKKQKWEPDREVIFYYNRERRLERASPAVRALNEGSSTKGGLIRSLTATKPLLIMFVTIIIIMVMIFLYSAIYIPKNSLTLGGNTLQVKAGRFQTESSDEAFISIKKNIAPNEGDPYIGEVYVGVSPILRSFAKVDPADIPVFTGQIFFTLEQQEEFRLDLPFTANNYLLLFQVGGERASARVKTE